MIRNAVLIPKTCRSIKFWHLMSSNDVGCHQMSCDVIRWHPMSQSTLIYMFLESAPGFWSFKPNLNKIWEHSRKNIFFIQWSPLWILTIFWSFLVFCPARFFRQSNIMLTTTQTKTSFTWWHLTIAKLKSLFHKILKFNEEINIKDLNCGAHGFNLIHL